MLLSDRVAIITGGARGIGKGIALKFAEEGCSIAIADVLDEEGAKTVKEVSAKGRKAIFVHCDVSNNFQVQKTIEHVIRKFKQIDILVNNAGIGPVPRPITEVSEEEWERVLAVNLKGAFLCCKAVVPYMKEKHYGRIINVSSIAAISPPAPDIHYSSAKAGMLGLSLDLALELASSNICVNAILPAGIRTEMLDQLVPPHADKEEFYRELGKALQPMERMGTPEDTAGVVLFLASSLSGYVTGDRIIVGGGYPLKRMV